MKYYSTRNNNLRVSFEEALKQGLAPDNGLFMPEKINGLHAGFFEEFTDMSLPEIAFNVGINYVSGEIAANDFKQICYDAFDFDIPLVKIKNGIYALELFHGPTAAFKDVGARFMSRCLGYFSQRTKEKTVILVATSGDTGSAVAQGFFNVEGVDVVILYPSGKVSHIQEQQLTTQGGNIKALEINGTFDDCQQMVKSALAQINTQNKFRLTSANSINIARLIPQSFYYYYAMAQLKNSNVVISVPSGNFGNLTGGLMAKLSGLPIHKFVAATNSNNTFPNYLNTGTFTPKASVTTISNAMDVGNPSNFERIASLFHHNVSKMGLHIASKSYTDEQTRNKMRQIYADTGYILDPHGAVALLGLEEEMMKNDCEGIFLETAHPAKFDAVVNETLNIDIQFPDSLEQFRGRTKQAIKMEASDIALIGFINDTYLY